MYSEEMMSLQISRPSLGWMGFYKHGLMEFEREEIKGLRVERDFGVSEHGRWTGIMALGLGLVRGAQHV
jgi:hypothetical protein